jgi:hypothetical protein
MRMGSVVTRGIEIILNEVLRPTMARKVLRAKALPSKRLPSKIKGVLSRIMKIPSEMPEN